MGDAQNSAIDTANPDLPIVAGASPSNWGMWGFFVVLAIGGFWLFSALSANRNELQTPSTGLDPAPSAGRIVAGPPLAVSPELQAPIAQLRSPAELQRGAGSQPAFSAQPRTIQPRIIPPVPQPFSIPPPPQPVAPNTGPSVVFDSAFQPAPAGLPSPTSADSNRVKAARFANPSLTIPQGTVIPAVLETALDSTRAGAARALVQRDIYSFDGTRVLIQRGSRLYGEYDSGLEAGQNRALIQWSRLIRPDGVTIALDSPSSDPLGRAGVKGKVDGKFLQRFGGAILQSILDIGVGVATREASSDGVIVALPGSTQNLQITDQQRVQRTLKVKHGTSVSVFVARDLDFSTVER